LALYSADGQWVNGKRAAAIFLSVRLSRGHQFCHAFVPGDRRKIPAKTFVFPATRRGSKWFSNFFEQPVTVRHSPEGFPDDAIANGPTIISTASCRSFADFSPA